MKFNSPQRFTSFYESFSDLIFATMAIFVLLMLVFLVLINPTSLIEELEKQLEQAEAENSQLEQELKEISEEAERSKDVMKEMVEEIAKLNNSVQARSLELVVAVDATASMTEPLKHLAEALITLGDVLPRISQNIRIGIVAYRLEAANANPTMVFPITQISSADVDGGRSLGELRRFIGQLRAKGGAAYVDVAIAEAIEMLERPTTIGEFKRSPDTNGYQSIMVLGDMGPWEDLSYEGVRIEPEERRRARSAADQIGRWARGNENRSVISLFTGNDATYEVEGVAYSRPHRQESRDFFRSLTSEARQPENFTDNPAKMLPFLLKSIVSE